jgi:hypothetical protein
MASFSGSDFLLQARSESFNPLQPISPAHDVVHRAWKFQSHFAWHRQRIDSESAFVKTKVGFYGLTPSMNPRRLILLLERHPHPQPVLIRVAHGIIVPWAIFAEKLPGAVVRINRCSDTVHHVCQLIFRIT